MWCGPWTPISTLALAIPRFHSQSPSRSRRVPRQTRVSPRRSFTSPCIFNFHLWRNSFRSSPTIKSSSTPPWRQAERPLSGVIHALYVFRVIDEWLASISAFWWRPAFGRHAGGVQIAEEIKQLDMAGVESGLTPRGSHQPGSLPSPKSPIVLPRLADMAGSGPVPGEPDGAAGQSSLLLSALRTLGPMMMADPGSRKSSCRSLKTASEYCLFPEPGIASPRDHPSVLASLKWREPRALLRVLRIFVKVEQFADYGHGHAAEHVCPKRLPAGRRSSVRA